VFFASRLTNQLRGFKPCRPRRTKFCLQWQFLSFPSSGIGSPVAARFSLFHPIIRFAFYLEMTHPNSSARMHPVQTQCFFRSIFWRGPVLDPQSRKRAAGPVASCAALSIPLLIGTERQVSVARRDFSILATMPSKDCAHLPPGRGLFLSFLPVATGICCEIDRNNMPPLSGFLPVCGETSRTCLLTF